MTRFRQHSESRCRNCRQHAHRSQECTMQAWLAREGCQHSCERGAVESLAVSPAAQVTVHDLVWMITGGMVHNAEPAIPVSPVLPLGSHCHQHARRTQDWIACEACHHTERADCGSFVGRSSSGALHGARCCVSNTRHPAVANVVIMRIGHKGIVQGDGCHMQAANLPSEQDAVDLLAVHSAGNLPAYSMHRCSKCHPHLRWLQEA